MKKASRATYTYRVRATRKGRLPVSLVKRGSKRVVTISRCDGDINQLLHDLQKALGTGGTVRPLSGVVEIQGEHSHFARVCAWLVEQRCVVGLSTQCQEGVLQSLIDLSDKRGKTRGSSGAQVPNSAKERALQALTALRCGSKNAPRGLRQDPDDAPTKRVRTKPRHVIRNADGTGRKARIRGAAWMKECNNAQCNWIYCCGQCQHRRSSDCDDMSDVYWPDNRYDGENTDPQPMLSSTSASQMSRKRKALSLAAVDESLASMGLLATTSKLARKYDRVELAAAKKKATQAQRATKRSARYDDFTKSAGQPQRGHSTATYRPRWMAKSSSSTSRTKNKKPTVRVYDDGFDRDSSSADSADEAQNELANRRAAEMWRQIANGQTGGTAATTTYRPKVTQTPFFRAVPLRKRSPDQIADTTSRQYLSSTDAFGDQRSKLGGAGVHGGSSKRLDEMDDEEVFATAVQCGVVDRHGPIIEAVLGKTNESLFDWRAFLAALPTFQPGNQSRKSSEHEEAAALSAQLDVSLDAIASANKAAVEESPQQHSAAGSKHASFADRDHVQHESSNDSLSDEDDIEAAEYQVLCSCFYCESVSLVLIVVFDFDAGDVGRDCNHACSNGLSRRRCLEHVGRNWWRVRADTRCSPSRG